MPQRYTTYGMVLSITNYSLLQRIFIIINLGLNISWKKFTIPHLLSQIYSKNDIFFS